MKYKTITILFSIFLLIQTGVLAASKDANPTSDTAGIEVKSLRTRTSKHYALGNGAFRAKMYTNSIHYRKNGEWLDIDLNIQQAEQKAGYPFSNTSNSFHTFYPATLPGQVVTVKGEFSLKEKVTGIGYADAGKSMISTFSMNANEGAGAVSGNVVRYSNVVDQINIQYTQLHESRKFEAILMSKSALKDIPRDAKYLSLQEEIELPENAIVSQDADGGLNILLNNTLIAYLPKPVASDKSMLESGVTNGSYSYEVKGNKLLLSTAFELDWLQSSSRVYPVSLDPTVVLDVFNVAMATGYMTSATGAKSSGYLRIAASGTIAWAKFDISPLAFTGATTITKAEYSGYHYTTTGADKIVNIVGMENVNPVTASNTSINTQITTGPNYSDTYIFGGSAYQYRVGALGANAFTDIIDKINDGWFALGFSLKSGNTTFMYQYGYNGTNLPKLEVEYSTTAPVNVPPIASYAYNDGDTVWINNPHTLVNTTNGAARSYWDILGYNSNSKLGPFMSVSANRQCKNSEGINDCFIDTSLYTNNFKWTYASAGYYRIKVTAINKFGNDTYIDTVYVDTPSAKPHTEFFIDKQVIGINDFASCFDLSSNGPTSWFWYLKSTTSNPFPLNPNRFTPFNTSQNPNLNAFDGGTFDLCLVTRNARGSDTLCKKDYIRIIPGYPVCAGQSADKDTIARDQEGSVMLSTVGGMYLPSLIGSCGKGFTISTCSDTVVMYVERFKMRTNVSGNTADSLLVYQGSTSGPVIARFGGLGASIPDSLRTFKVPGGIAYLQTKLAATTGLAGDSGYTLRWTSVPATYPKPIAAFSVPDTIYDKYTVQYINQSSGVQVKYAWDTNGDNVYGLDNPSSGIDSTTTNPSRSFNVFAPYKANICLKAYNCVGADTACKQVQFLPISTSPVAEFTVNRITGFTTDTFRFTDLTQNGATSWNWTFVPNNVAYLYGTNAGSQHPIVLLNSATAYDITLTATNPLGSNSITKLSYATAIAFNSPGCSGCPDNSVPGSIDVGISQVSLADMDTITAMNTPIYHALYNVKTATLYRGVTYNLSTARTTNSAPMSTRAWIDFNHNTNFGDEAIETIISENNQNKSVTTGSFKVPDDAPLGNTRMRIGVTLGGTDITQSVTTLGCYEDYGILIGIDVEKPILSLNGLAIEKVEVNKTYTEMGVFATDNLEGDISHKFEVFGTVDMTTLGYYTLKYIVRDLYGNVSDTAYRTVQVEINQTGPSVTINGDDSVYVDVFASYTELGATAYSNNGIDFTSLIVKTGTVDTTTLGTYVIHYSITDQFNFTAVAKRWVIVQDTMKPVINSKAGTATFYHQVGVEYHDPIVVSDNYWQNIIPTRSGTIIPNTPGTYNLLYNAVDGSGNVAATFHASVVVKDLIPPTVKLFGENPMYVDVFTTFIDPGVETSDNYYPNTTMVRAGVPTMNTIGTFTITYTVTDGAHNTTVVTRTVNVVDRMAPTILIMGKNPFTHHRFKEYEDPGVKLIDNYYSDAALRGSLKTDASEVKVDVPGLYFVYYTLTDPSGNTAMAERRLVEVVEYTGLKDEMGETTINVFPNPSEGMFTITAQSAISRLQVLDVLGKVVVDQTMKETTAEVDLTSFKKGVYFIKVETEDGRSGVQKMVIQ